MTRFLRFAMLAFPASLILAACSGTDVNGSDTLDGQWEIEQIADESGDLAPPLDMTRPFVAFTEVSTDKGSLSGNTGCNNFSGQVEVTDDGGFDAGPFTMTLMGCPDSLGEQEGLILTHLSAANAWAVEGDTATLSSRDNVLVSMRRIDTSLENSAWEVTGINNQRGGVQSIVADTEPTLFFGADGVLAGNTGCNDLSASYVTDERSIEIGDVATTRKFCTAPDGLMDQEQNMKVALAEAATYRFRGFGLILSDADGSTLLNARRMPESGR